MSSWNTIFVIYIIYYKIISIKKIYTYLYYYYTYITQFLSTSKVHSITNTWKHSGLNILLGINNVKNKTTKFINNIALKCVLSAILKTYKHINSYHYCYYYAFAYMSTWFYFLCSIILIIIHIALRFYGELYNTL